MIRILAMVVAVAAAASCLAQQPFVVEQEASYQISFGNQISGDMVWGNGEYFAVWCDQRRSGLTNGLYDIYFQRLTPGADNKDPGSRVLIRDTRIKVSPCVGWNGSVYLVCYQDGSKFFGQRVSAGGEVLDPLGFQIHDFTVNNGIRAGIASDGDGFLVTWASGSNIYAKRISAAGEVLDATPMVLSSGGIPTVPRVAFGAGRYVVTWSLNSSVRAMRVLADGTLMDPVGGVTIAAGVSGSPTPLFDGHDFMVIFRLRDAQQFIDLMSVKVTPELSVIFGPSLVVEGDPWGHVGIPHISRNGSNYLVAFSPPEPASPLFDDAYGVMMDLNGLPLGAPFIISNRPDRSSTIFGAASNGTDYFTVWVCNQNSASIGSLVDDTYGSRITASGQVLDPDPTNRPVSTSASWQAHASSSFDGQNHLIVFEDRRVGPPLYQRKLYGMFVNQQGQTQSGAAFPIAAGAGPKEYPETIFANGQHLVVYESAGSGAGEIRAARVMPDGTVLDPAGHLVGSSLPSGTLYNPQIAWNGSKYCVVWYDDYIDGGTQPLRFAILNADGSKMLGPVYVPNSFFTSFSDFDVASDGAGFCIAWSDLDVLRATRVSGAGAVQGTTTVAPMGADYHEYPKIAWNGGSYLISWKNGDLLAGSMKARRLSPAGQLLGSQLNLSSFAEGTVPERVSVEGTDFYAHWSVPGAGGVNVMRARIDAAGAVMGSEQVFTAPDSEFYGSLSLGFGAPGQTLVMWPQWTDDPYNAPRLHGAVLGGPTACYANCDGSTTQPVLNVADFSCFLVKFASGDPYANCDQSTLPPVLNVADFACFLTKFAAGCP